MTSIVFHPLAELEMLEAQLYYKNRSEVAAQAFALHMEHALSTISESPETWPTVRGEVRRYVLTRYPFSVLYRLEANHVFVTAIAHQSRRPGYWHDR